MEWLWSLKSLHPDHNTTRAVKERLPPPTIKIISRVLLNFGKLGKKVDKGGGRAIPGAHIQMCGLGFLGPVLYGWSISLIIIATGYMKPEGELHGERSVETVNIQEANCSARRAGM